MLSSLSRGVASAQTLGLWGSQPEAAEQISRREDSACRTEDFLQNVDEYQADVRVCVCVCSKLRHVEWQSPAAVLWYLHQGCS